MSSRDVSPPLIRESAGYTSVSQDFNSLTAFVKDVVNKIYEIDEIANIVYDTIHESKYDTDHLLDQLMYRKDDAFVIVEIARKIQRNAKIRDKWSKYDNNNLCDIMLMVYQNRILNLNRYNRTLHRFSPQHLCGNIELLVINDCGFKSNLSKIKTVFRKCSFSGQIMSSLTMENAKRIVRNELLSFITEDTLNIMFDCYEKWRQHIDDTMKSEEEMAEMLLHFPLRNLLNRIKEDKIDGKQLIDSIINKKNADVISMHTGWSEDDVYQIQSILFRHHTFTRSQFIQNMDVVFKQYNTWLSKEVIDEIRKVILDFDVEDIHYKIKNAQNIDTFSRRIINMVDDLMQKHESNKDEVYFVKKVYETIAECFIFKSHNDKCLKLQHWICNKCSNCNVNAMIDGKTTIQIIVCTLCGILQRDQIMLKIRNRDSYIMKVNDVAEHKYTDEGLDDIDLRIQKLFGDKPFMLCCPNQNNNDHCMSMLRLVKVLIIYQRWLYTIYAETKGKDDIEKGVQVDIIKFTDDDEFKNLFIESIKSTESITVEQMQLLIGLINNNIDNIADIDVFISSPRLKFAKKICKETGIKVGKGARLYSTIKQSLTQHAQSKQYHAFLSDLDMDTMSKDYHHILNIHIIDGNKMNVENAFTFFEYVVNFPYLESEIERHRSLQETRTNAFNVENKEENKEGKSNNKYVENQLGTIHSLLVHSNWRNVLQRYSNQDLCYDKNDERNERFCLQNKEKGYGKANLMNIDNNGTKPLKQTISKVDPLRTEKGKAIELLTQLLNNADDVDDKTFVISNQNNGKYETLFDSGIDHSHPYLKPRYDSIYYELLLNKLHQFSLAQIQNMLVKAIEKHRIALYQYKDKLICKRYHRQYNIIRNELIGLRHICSIILFTDNTLFCTVFRRTYRKVNNESIDEVTERHQELYYYARTLYESIEYFGECMNPNLKMYHMDRDRFLYFQRFTLHFNPPMSLTTELETAIQWYRDNGVILCLKPATQKVKYLSVSWLSDFPQEGEQLCYGQFVEFKIENIHNIENGTWKSHSKILNFIYL